MFFFAFKWQNHTGKSYSIIVLNSMRCMCRPWLIFVPDAIFVVVMMIGRIISGPLLGDKIVRFFFSVGRRCHTKYLSWDDSLFFILGVRVIVSAGSDFVTAINYTDLSFTLVYMSMITLPCGAFFLPSSSITNNHIQYILGCAWSHVSLVAAERGGNNVIISYR